MRHPWGDSSDEDDEEELQRRRQSRILIFATKSDLKKLVNSDVWHLDGTFETCPEIFSQILTIHGKYLDETLPFVYALLPNKTEATYRRVLDGLIEVCRDYRLRQPRPRLCVMDFEKGLNNAVRSRFPETELKLCLFHLRQASFRKLQALGLQPAYSNEEDTTIRDAYRQVVGVAFVPPEDVPAAFEEAKRASPPQMREFNAYFEKYYVKGTPARGRGRGRAPPRYMIALWNQYEAALHNEPRTNNLKEAWHNRFQVIFIFASAPRSPWLMHLK